MPKTYENETQYNDTIKKKNFLKNINKSSQNYTVLIQKCHHTHQEFI